MGGALALPVPAMPSLIAGSAGRQTSGPRGGAASSSPEATSSTAARATRAAVLADTMFEQTTLETHQCRVGMKWGREVGTKLMHPISYFLGRLMALYKCTVLQPCCAA